MAVRKEQSVYNKSHQIPQQIIYYHHYTMCVTPKVLTCEHVAK